MGWKKIRTHYRQVIWIPYGQLIYHNYHEKTNSKQKGGALSNFIQMRWENLIHETDFLSDTKTDKKM